VNGAAPGPIPARLRPVEWMLVGYAGFVGGLGAARLATQPAIAWVLGANLLILGLVLLMAHEPMGRTGRSLRELYPVLLLSAMYPAVDILNNFGGITVHDRTVQRWELALFGSQPSREWWQHSQSVFWSTVFHTAYLAYYPIVVTPLVVFLVAGRWEDARRAVRWIVSTFLLCYVVFLLFPVAGPYYEFPRPSAWFIANLPARLVYATLARGSAYGAAFPSSHVAATVVATAAAFAGSRTLGWILLIPAVLLTVGVVYCQMHYAVDALAGLALGGAVVALWRWRERYD
jgi:membrane-associated phospholipid phosphatase